MKISKRSRIILISIALLVLIAGGVFFVVKKYQDKKANATPTSSTKDNPATNETTARSTNEEKTNSTNSSASQSNGNVSVTITNAMQTSDGIVRVGSLVNGTSSGTCTLKFEKAGSSTITKTAPIGLQISYNICKGFNDIPASEFSAKGEWRATISVSSANGNAQSETKVVSIN